MARSVAWSYLGAASEVIAGLVLIGYIVRRISVAEYGLLLLAISLGSLTYLLDLGLENLLVQGYVEAASDSLSSVTILLSTAFTTLTLIGLIGGGGMAAFALLLPGPFNIPKEYVGEAIAIFVLVGISTAVGFPTIALNLAFEAFQRFDRINQLQALLAVLRVVLTVVLLARGYGVVALAVIHVVLALTRLLVLAAALHWSIPGVRLDLLDFDWRRIRPLLSLGGWSALDNISRQVASSSDSFILGVFGPVASVAIFGLGNKLPAQLSNLVIRGAGVILPSLAQHHADADKPRLRNLFLHAQRLVVTGALPVVVLGCVCARPLIQVWAGSAYVGAVPVMQWLLLAALSMALEYSAGLLLYACGEVKRASLITTVASVANLLVSLMLVFRYGAVGLAAGTALTHVMINVFWYTPSACRTAGISFSELMRIVFAGQAATLSLLCVEALLLFLLPRVLSPLGTVIVGIIFGVSYLALWSVKTVIPLRRMPVEAAD